MTPSQMAIAPVFPVWLIVLLLCLGPLAAFAEYWATRERLGFSRALAISLLRLGAISLLALFALNPSREVSTEHRLPPTVTILVDSSQSMGQAVSKEKGSRLDEARAVLTGGANPLLHSLRERFDVSLYGMGSSLRPLDPGELARLTAEGEKGNLTGVLGGLRQKNTLAVLVSDGRLGWDEAKTPGLPTIILPVGDPKEYKDALIKGIKAPSLAFRGREVQVEVTIKGYGYEGMSLPVLLTDSEKSKLLATKTVRIPADAGEATATLSFVPDQVGQNTLLISVPQQVGEAIVTNNQTLLSIHVVRDKTRILMVSGMPSMNYRFMRMVLKNDPSIDLLSFVILRTPSDILNVPPREQSLIPFPVESLFIKELSSFDLVIFDNFNYPLFLSPQHLEGIRDFVKGGGGFATIGGPNLFREDPSGSSPLGELLPLQFLEKEFYRRDSPVGVRVSRAGTTHPMMRLFDDVGGDGTDPHRFWQELPPLDGINLMEVKRPSTVLLESAGAIPRPILAVSDVGKGRVLALATDYSWKWYMGMVAVGKGTQLYSRLMHKMVRWLTRDPSLDPIQIIPSQLAASAGQLVEARVHVREQDLSRKAGAPPSFSVFNPEGIKIESTLKSTAQPGEYLVSFRPGKGGVYRLTVESPVGQQEASLVVAGPLETFDAAPDHEQLRRISASTGGVYVSKAEDLPQAIERYTQSGERRFLEERRSPIWATPVVLAVLLGLLCSEWYCRRRWGLM